MSQKQFVSFWLCSAAFVVVARFLHATDPGYDLTIQIQAAQNLLRGNGLSMYALSGGNDLATPIQLETLTYFPAGYSFCAAILLAMGLSAAMVVKIWGALATVLAWWGWGALAFSFMRDGLSRGPVWRGCAVVIALLTPLGVTPPWSGTDIFLWAAIPWILRWVVKAAERDESGGLRFDLLAGAVCGACFLMRYASLFLALYAGFLILCQSANRWQTLLRRSVSFATGLLPFLALQFYLNHLISAGAARPGGLDLDREIGLGAHTLWGQLRVLPVANFSVVWWLPLRWMTMLVEPLNRAPWLIGIAFAVIALPVLVALKVRTSSLRTAARDIRPAAAGLFVALPASLLACAMFGAYYAGVQRYYWPLVPLSVLVAYSLALREHEQESKWTAAKRIVSRVYLSGYVFMLLFGLAFLLVPGERGFGRRQKVLGTWEFRPWPSMAMTFEFSPARQWVMASLKQEPATILVTNRPQWFYADSEVDRSRVHRIRDVRASYVSGPARILILAEDPPTEAVRSDEGPAERLYWFSSQRKPRRVRRFDHIPELQLITRFPEENIKIMEARIPAGRRVVLSK